MLDSCEVLQGRKHLCVLRCITMLVSAAGFALCNLCVAKASLKKTVNKLQSRIPSPIVLIQVRCGGHVRTRQRCTERNVCSV